MSTEELQAKAVQKYLRRSPRKVRLLADQVRGQNFEDAIQLLQYSKRGAAAEVSKVIKSAAANLRDQNQEERIDDSQLYVKTIFVDEGTTLKRIKPAAMGRANPIRKKTSHITVIVARPGDAVLLRLH